MAATPDSATRRYPYTSYATFKAFVLGLAPEAMTSTVGRSTMGDARESTKPHLLHALHALALVGPGGEVLDPLVRMSISEDAFRNELRAIIRDVYAAPLRLADQGGSTSELTWLFARAGGYSGSTLRKAVTFFLHAAADCDIAVSPNFRTPQRTDRYRFERAAASSATRSQAARHSVQLSSGGTLVLLCTSDLLSLDAKDRDFVFGLVDAMRAYEGRQSQSG